MAVNWVRWNPTSHIYELSTNDGASFAALPLDASILNQGTVAPARLGSGSGGSSKFLREDSTWQTAPVTTDASALTSGLVARARGGTGQDMTVTGGASHFLRQLSFNGAIDTGRPASSDLSDTANVVLKNAANVFSLAGNSFSELLGVAKGLSFPATQVPSSGANDLDDYEEGSWTPLLSSDNATPASGQTYTTQVGRYIKVGRKVTCFFTAQLSVKGTIGAGSISINGLPFTVFALTAGYGAGMVFQWSNLTTNWASIGLRVEQNTTLAYPIATDPGGVLGASPTFPTAPTEWTATSFMAGVIQYFSTS